MTLKQIRANRLNAQKCAGPRSDAGKARSGMNALKTGIYAQAQILSGEDPTALKKLSTEFYEYHEPETPIDAQRNLDQLKLLEAERPNFEPEPLPEPEAEADPAPDAHQPATYPQPNSMKIQSKPRKWFRFVKTLIGSPRPPFSAPDAPTKPRFTHSLTQ